MGIAGFRIFECDECGTTWKEPCRDAASLSTLICECGNSVEPKDYELRPDWPTDVYGNLIHGKEYK